MIPTSAMPSTPPSRASSERFDRERCPVHPGISLDAGADAYVTRIFGARNYLVLDHIQRLPEKLPLLYLRLSSQGGST